MGRARISPRITLHTKGLNVTTFIGVLLIIAGPILLYALVIRPWLKKQTWAQGFFEKIEAIETTLYKKSETVLVGRLVWVGGFIVSAYDSIAEFAKSLDLTPLTTRIFDFLHIPPDMRGLAASASLMGLGLLMVRLRKTTTKPLELVAAPEKTTPVVQAALAQADVAKEQALAAVKAGA